MNEKIMSWLPFIAIVVLLPAISGPLLVDDSIHLGPIMAWLSNRTDTFELIFGNASGPFGRPISIFSFVLNALTTGQQIWPMKLTNLALHLITVLCLAKLFLRLFKRDANLVDHAKIASLAAASLWLILPQHISTVFYLIQRMTILAALFSVLACWLYVIAREQIEANRQNGFLLLSGVPVLAALSIFSKESGIMIPLYCLLIEMLYFPASVARPRPRIIAWAFRAGVIAPCLLVAAYLAFNPGFVLDGYIDRPFSMPERVMTQILVVADYFTSTFLPMVRSATVYNDDFPISHSLASQEVLILLVALSLIIAAILCHKNYPSFSFGIGLFFSGHLLESSILPLEIYFAHRNYLPSMGLVLAAFGLFAGFLHRYPEPTASIKRILPVAFAGLILAYAFAGFNRAQLWSSNNSLIAHALVHHPTSSRMRSEILLNALYAKRLDIALQQADIALQTSPANEKRTIQLWRILAYCYAETPQPKAELDVLQSMYADRISLATATALNYVSAAAEANSCPGLDSHRLGLLANQWAINTSQSPYVVMVWQTHLSSAKLLAATGDYRAAFAQARWAFIDSGHYSFEAGLMALQLTSNLEDTYNRKLMLNLLTQHKEKFSEGQKLQLQELKTYFEKNSD